MVVGTNSVPGCLWVSSIAWDVAKDDDSGFAFAPELKRRVSILHTQSRRVARLVHLFVLSAGYTSIVEFDAERAQSLGHG